VAVEDPRVEAEGGRCGGDLLEVVVVVVMVEDEEGGERR